MSYTQFQIGEPFPLSIQAQGDGGIFQYDINGAMFILRLSKVDLIAIEAFRTGKIELALFAKQNILFFLYRIDGIFKGWGDCPYSIHYHDPAQQPDFSKAPAKELNLYLVDSRLNLLLAMRTTSFSAEFHGKLAQQIQAQRKEPLTKPEYIAAVQSLWQQYTSDEMYNHAAVKQVLPNDPANGAAVKGASLLQRGADLRPLHLSRARAMAGKSSMINSSRTN